MYTELSKAPSATFAPVILNFSQYEFEGFIPELTFRVKQSDGTYVSMRSDYYDAVWMIAARPDGVVYEIKGSVIDDGTYVSIPLRKGITDLPGDVICELVWVAKYGNEIVEQNASANFILRIEPSPKMFYGNSNTVIDDSGGGDQPYNPNDPQDEPKYRMVIVTPPNKTTYNEGDSLVLTGVRVNLEKYTDNQGVLETTDITTACTYSPASGATLTPSNTAITVTYVHSSKTLTGSIPITVGSDPKQYRLVVATPPTKTTYNEGESLNLSGLKINLEEYTANQGVIKTTDVTSSCTFSPVNGTQLSSSNTSVTATYIK